MKKIFSLVLVLILTLSLFLGVTVFADETAEGFAFSDYSNIYKLDTVPDKNPLTFEAEIYFEKDTPLNKRGGVIFGNFGGEARCINFEIYKNGNPRLYWVSSTGAEKSAIFNEVNVYSGAWVHLAITVDNNADQVHCYINGELIQTLPFENASEELCSKGFVVGGDFRNKNLQNFKGRIKSLAIYSDIRTAQEIKNDMVSLDKSDLIVAYDFKNIGSKAPETLSDLSNNKNNASLKPAWAKANWIKNVESDFKSAFSFAVIGDTQTITQANPSKFPKIYDYILDNIEKKNIKAVIGLGDITNDDTAAEWALAKATISRLNGKVPYTLARGNHDGSTNFNNTFIMSGYKELLGGTYDETVLNSWLELTIGDLQYLIITLDYRPNDTLLDWASDLIESHPAHNVIIVTHSYLYKDGTTIDDKDEGTVSSSSSNNGELIWEKLVSQHENIVLVLSGHIINDEIVMTQTAGKNGHTVTQFLINPQRVDTPEFASGLVAMFYFSEDGKNLRVEYYSTVRDRYFMEENQFEVTLDLADPNAVFTTPDTVTPTQSPIPNNDQANNQLLLPVIIGSVVLVAVITAVVIIIKKKKN